MPDYEKFKKTLTKMLDDSILDHSIDCDHPECPNCRGTMAFHGHDDYGDYPLGEGYWKCENCGFAVKENEL